MRHCNIRITSRVRKGLCVYFSNSGFAFSNSSIPCLLVHMILALVQRLFRARISRQCAWISIGIIMRRCRKRITSQVRKGLFVYCTNSRFAFANSSIPCLLVHMIFALVQRFFRRSFRAKYMVRHCRYTQQNERRYTVGVTSLSAKRSAQRPISPVGEGIELRRLLLLHSENSPERWWALIGTSHYPFTLSGRLSPTSTLVLCELSATKLFYCLSGCLGHDYYERNFYTSWLSKHPLW